MRTLPRFLRKNGYAYSCILRNCKSAIYQVQVTPNLTYYEVFLIHRRPEKELFGKTIPEREVFPSDEDFGTRACTYPNLQLAVNKLLELNHHKLPAKKDDRSKSGISF